MNRKQIGLLAAFAAARVEFAIVGGIAVIAHGYERTTSDLDLFIRPTEENACAAYEGLRMVNAPVDGMTALDLLDDETHFRFGLDGDSVDILASIGEMPFDQVWRNRVHARMAGLSVPFISKQDLIENKKATGRLRDLADVDELEHLPDVEFDG